MDAKNPTSGDILKRLELAIEKAENALRVGGQGDAQFGLALRSVKLLRSLLHKFIEQLADRDLAERAAVYNLIAERCGAFLDRSPDLVYPVVLSLCAESDSNLTEDLPEPDPKITSSLEQVLLQVTVTYSFQDERAERVVLIVVQDLDNRQVREQKVTVDIPWESIPDDVRERFVRNDRHPVTFTLYPRET